jgi:hypothetical protein
MKKILYSFVISAFLTLASVSFAAMSDTTDTTKALKGTIDQIGKDLITISQSNPTVRSQTASMAKVDIAVDENTQYKNVDSMAQLQKGDDIRVQYKEDPVGQRVAVEIAKLNSTTDNPNYGSDYNSRKGYDDTSDYKRNVDNNPDYAPVTTSPSEQNKKY